MYTTKNRRPVTCKSTRSMLQLMVYSTAFKQKPNNKLKPYTDINKSLLKATCRIVRVRCGRDVLAWNENVDFDAKLHLALREDLWSNESWQMGKHRWFWKALHDKYSTIVEYACTGWMWFLGVCGFSFMRSACEILRVKTEQGKRKQNQSLTR